METFYTPESLAKRLNVSYQMVTSMLRRREIPSYKIGRCRRIDPEDVASYLAQRKEE